LVCPLIFQLLRRPCRFWLLLCVKGAELQSVESVSKVSCVLLELGFDMHLLGSESYVKAKLENLTSAQLSKVREAFVKSSHPRFKKGLWSVDSSHLEKLLITLYSKTIAQGVLFEF
jgi:hypothetical protein